jgi:hypothetical protein
MICTENLLIKLERVYPHDGIFSDLFDNSDFNKLIENFRYKKDYNNFKIDLKSKEQWIILSFAIGLSDSLDANLWLLKTSLRLLNEQVISDKTFRLSIFPGYSINTIIPLNYNTQDINKLLKDVTLSQFAADKTKSKARKYLTGKSAMDIQMLQNGGQLPEKHQRAHTKSP